MLDTIFFILFLLSHSAATFSTYSSTKNELKMSSGQLLQRVAVQVKKKQSSSPKVQCNFVMLEFPFKDILTHVNLAISDATDTLLIPEEEHSEVKKSVEKVFRQPRPRRTITNALESPSSSTADQGYTGSDDGRVVIEVQPEQQTEGVPRRSTRKRNAIVYDS